VTAAQVVWLVTRRELREAVRGKTFLVSSVIVLVLLAGIAGLSALTGGRPTVTVGVAGARPQGLSAALTAAADPFGSNVKLRPYPSAYAAQDAVAHRKVDAALVGGSTLVVRPSPPNDVVAIVGSALRTLELPRRAARLGISRRQARALVAPPVAVTQVQAASGSDSQARYLALLSTILLFLALSIYGQTVMMSVVQEKSNRVVEVLLATLRPRHLLAGKVAGIGLLGLAQLATVGVAAFVAGSLGAFDLPSLGRTAPLALLWFLLGFCLYAVAFAAVGALVARVEDASAAALPVTMVMLVCYLASFGVVDKPDGTLATVLTLLPPSAPFVVPARSAATSIPLWQFGLGVALMLAAIWGCIRLAGRIYEYGLLRSGPRVPLREAVRVAAGRA